MLAHAALFPCSLLFLLSWCLLSRFLPGRCRPEAQQVVVYYAFTFSSTTFFIFFLHFFPFHTCFFTTSPLDTREIVARLKQKVRAESHIWKISLCFFTALSTPEKRKFFTTAIYYRSVKFLKLQFAAFARTSSRLPSPSFLAWEMYFVT